APTRNKIITTPEPGAATGARAARATPERIALGPGPRPGVGHTLVARSASTRTRDDARRVTTVTNVFASNPGGTAPAYPQDAPAPATAARGGHQPSLFCPGPPTRLRAVIATYPPPLRPAPRPTPLL